MTKPTAIIIRNNEKLKAFPPNSGRRHRCPVLPLWCNINSTGSPSHNNQRKGREEGRKSTHVGREEVKLSLFTDTLYFNTENPKASTKKLLEQMNSVNLQDTRLIYRNLMLFYTILTNYQKAKKKKSHLKLHQKK